MPVKLRPRALSSLTRFLLVFSLVTAVLTQVWVSSASGEAASAAYPDRSDYRIKSIQPDSWPDKDEIAGNNTGGVALNLVWAEWEPELRLAPCPAGQIEYDGHCFRVPTGLDTDIREWTARGLVVTAVIFGTPQWARAGKPCSPVSPGYEWFCTPNNPADFGRFAGMLAKRYNGSSGNGRIADMIVNNEVNTNAWFDIGCGQGVACDTRRWLDEIAANYIAVYDKAAGEQPTTKVLTSLDNQFGTELERPNAHDATLSGMTVLRGLDARIGSRELRVGFHPYPRDLRSIQVSPDDYPYVTYGNLGVLVGWLRVNLPHRATAWSDVQLTESGLNSAAPSTPQQQASATCSSFRNVLATPGINNYVYHRMRDHPSEVGSGLSLGLRNTDGSAKPSWATWALANRNDLSTPLLSCGFELLPHVKLAYGNNPTRGSWTSTRELPAGFTKLKEWKLLRRPSADTVPLYECRVGQHNLVSRDSGCEDQFPLGPLGHAYLNPRPGTVALYRCYVPTNGDHFVSDLSNCDGATVEGPPLGYVVK
ncbi:DUF5722 domain-containing protein [Amycolatopsis sp. 195334CR]|uniref:DUF5722 domain-containing protein n=1 Tax=Amycolatopsis sp. 195334CR TaxID=2814588 RepID=UPI001A8D14B4|nr:DUF5722 domain-containing protein [Amycolatopsis sp. 195334CR]MBN6034105.1 hypothetical protein [Amycolatopsis sp. 195334CR]